MRVPVGVAVILAALAVLVASGVAAFGVYSWRWKEPAWRDGDEETLAGVFARELAGSLGATGGGAPTTIDAVIRLAPGIWRVKATPRRSGAGGRRVGA